MAMRQKDLVAGDKSDKHVNFCFVTISRIFLNSLRQFAFNELEDGRLFKILRRDFFSHGKDRRNINNPICHRKA